MNSVFNNVSLPTHQYAYVRTEFCNNLDPSTAGLMPCVIFGAESIPGRALGFHILREDGAMISQLPINALCWHESAMTHINPGDLQLWDCFGYDLSVHCFDYLKNLEGRLKAFNSAIWPFTYICTFDFLNNGFSDYPEQHKCLHFLKLHNGQFALQPNNRLQFIDLSFTDRLFSWENPPRIATNKLEWFCETAETGEPNNGRSDPTNGIHEPK